MYLWDSDKPGKPAPRKKIFVGPIHDFVLSQHQMATFCDIVHNERLINVPKDASHPRLSRAGAKGHIHYFAPHKIILCDQATNSQQQLEAKLSILIFSIIFISIPIR